MLDVYSCASGDRRHLGSVSPSEVLEGLQELGVYSILRPDKNSNLYIDDSPIPTESESAFWEWSPGFYSGRVTVEVVSPTSYQPKTYFFDVAPDQKKIDKAQFANYLQDIADYLPDYLLGSEPAKTGLGGKSPLVSLWVAYTRLKANADAYLRGLQMIRERPITRLKYLRDRVNIYQAKKIDAATISGLRSNPALLEALSQRREKTHENSSLVRDTRVNVPFHDPSVDNPPNRLILQQILEVARHAAWLRSQLSNYQSRPSDTETDVRKSLPRRLAFLDRFVRKLRQITTSEPFSIISMQTTRGSGLNAVSANPVYYRSHKLGMEILKKGVSELTFGEMQHLSSTWRIYEAWCFCAIAAGFEKSYPDYQWSLNKQRKYTDCMLEGKKGNTRIRLYDQLVCPSLENANSYGYMSISRERRPDFVIEYETPDTRNFICVDAKYRVSQQGLLDAMSSAHIYQNSLKLDGKPPIACCLVAPHVKNVNVLSQQRYWEEYQVACFAMGDKTDVDILLATVMLKFGQLDEDIN